MGAAWFLAATGVYLRDVGHTTGIITTMMLFLAPVFYPLAALPEKFRMVLHLNPVTFIIEQTRDVLIWGELPDRIGLGLYFVGVFSSPGRDIGGFRRCAAVLQMFSDEDRLIHAATIDKAVRTFDS